MENRYDLVVIGSGPGGYVAAIRASKLGMKTAIVESREIGGTCLNRGCIPTKTLMHSSRLYQEAKSFARDGIHIEGLGIDLQQLQDRKNEVVDKSRQGIISLLKANGVDILHGTAMIYRDRQIKITSGTAPEEDFAGKTAEKDGLKPERTADNSIMLSADKILIATGSKPVIPNITGVNLNNVITSDELLTAKMLYRKLLIIGGGVIGIEFASIYSDLGCEVEIIEAMDRILPNMDKEISQSIAMSMKKKGVVIHTGAKVTGISEDSEGSLICEFEEKGSLKTTVSEAVLLSVGRRAYTEGLFAEEVSVEYDGAMLKVNEAFETGIPGIYAIGDVIRGKQLAHAASAQAVAAVEGMCNMQPSVDLNVIPSCIYTVPEAATVGHSEEEAVKEGYTVKVGKYPMLGNGKTLLSNGERGFIKVICDATTDRIIGAQLLCDRATDMVSEFATAIVNGLTAKDMARVIRPHPTYSEAVTEAVEDVEGMAIHLIPKRRI